MNIAAQLLDAGNRLQESVLGNPTIVYRGKHIPCTYSSVDRGLIVAFGGNEEEVQLSAFIRQSARQTRTVDANEGWTADADDEPTGDEDLLPPQVGKRVMANQRHYRIIRVITDPAGAMWKVQLGSINR